MMPPVRHFILMRIGLSTLLVTPAMPLHAERFHGERAASHAQNTGLDIPGHHATSRGVSNHAAFFEEGKAGTACERGKTRAKLFIMKARAALAANRIDAIARRWAENKQRLKSHSEAQVTHLSCAVAEAETHTYASHTASASTKHKDPRTGLPALGVEQRGEVEFQAKSKSATKRKPAEQAVVAGREGALARPTGLCAMAMGKPRVRLRPPVHGVIAKGWGEATDAGPATGISYQALSGARVLAPCGGRVVFANSFRSYGQLLIVDCGGGYHMILSGLEKLDVQSGQTIDAGEIVGVMPFSEPRSTMHRQILYIELRHNGHPVNPTLWLRNSG